MKKIVIALKDNGLIYTSFKYGTFEGVRNGRYFIDGKREIAVINASFNEGFYEESDLK